MPVYLVTDPKTGQKVKLTGDSPPTEQELNQIFASLPSKTKIEAPIEKQPVAQQPTLADKVEGGLQAAAALGSSIVAEPLAGLAGIAASLNPFNEAGAGAERVEQVRDQLTYKPTKQGAKDALTNIAETVEPLATATSDLEKTLGDYAMQKTGSPTLAAAATALPTALGELIGVATLRSGSRAADKIKRISNAKPDERVSSIMQASKELDVPVLTTDLFPPESFLGKTAQSISEKLGPLGSGAKRSKQQAARIDAVEAFSEGIELDTPFAESMVNSLNKKTARTLERAGEIRSQAVSKLDAFGDFPNQKAVDEINKILEKQSRLGSTANKQLTDELTGFKNELSQPTDFSLTKDLRTQLIKKVKAFSRAEDTAPAAELQKVKSALDKDMIAFARAKDKPATRAWLASNRKFAEELGVAKDTEIKRLLQSGEATPEKVMPILKGGKASELNRLHNALGEKGRAAARGALLQQALKDSKFFEVDINANPDVLATTLNKPNFQQAAKVFFKGKDKNELKGFTRLMNATRKAQSGQALVKTGEQLLVPTAGGAVGASVLGGILPAAPVVGLAAVGSAIAKTYESKAFRNLLIKLNNTQPGSKLETKYLDALATVLVSGNQVSKEQQQKNQ